MSKSNLLQLAILTIAGGGLGLAWHSSAKPVFVNEAIIRIEPKPIPVMCNPAGQTFPIRSKPKLVHEEAMASHETISSCLETQAELKTLPSLVQLSADRRDQEIVANLILSVDREDSSIFHLSYRCIHPDDGIIILNAVIQTYRRILDEVYSKTKSSNLTTEEEKIDSLLHDFRGYRFSIIKNAAPIPSNDFLDLARRVILGSTFSLAAAFCVSLIVNRLPRLRHF